MRPYRPDLRPDRPNLRPERPNVRPEGLDLSPEGPDLRPERPDLRPERPDLKPERSDLRPEGPDEGGDGRTNKQTDGRTNESPPVFYRTLSPSRPLPKKLKIIIKSNMDKEVAQGQYMVSDTHCPALHGCKLQGSGPEGDKNL